MKIKALLITLLLATNFIIGHGQEYRVPSRKEIRDKVKFHPQDNTLQQAATRAEGDYIMQEFPTTGEVRGLVLLVAYKDVPFSLPDDSIRTLLQSRYDGEDYTEQIEHRGFSQVDNDTIALRATIPGSARDYFKEMSQGKFTPRFGNHGTGVLVDDRLIVCAIVSTCVVQNDRPHYIEARSKLAL